MLKFSTHYDLTFHELFVNFGPYVCLTEKKIDVFIL